MNGNPKKTKEKNASKSKKRIRKKTLKEKAPKSAKKNASLEFKLVSKDDYISDEDGSFCLTKFQFCTIFQNFMALKITPTSFVFI